MRKIYDKKLLKPKNDQGDTKNDAIVARKKI
jgi:hypothetical protein